MTATRTLRVGEREVPLVGPSARDPRLHLASVIVSVQVLGQTLLAFDLSIAQILVSLVTCAAIEVAVTLRRTGSLVWPASALLTGNGVALILRVPGTEHGDWWSMHGWYWFAGIAALSLASKYVIRYRGGHVFNPSNIGLVVAFLVLGEQRIEPLDFWWGSWSLGVALATGIIVAGGIVITRRIGMLGMAAGFWVTFAASLAVVAIVGHCMTATWRFGAICDWSFWWVLATSPEVLIFLFFMITDPKTTPADPKARVLFGVGVGLAAALLAAPQTTEYATKVAVLASLAVMCVARYPLERWLDRRALSPTELARRVALAVAVGMALVVVVGLPARHVDESVAAGRQPPVRDVDTDRLPVLGVSDDMRAIYPAFSDRHAATLASDVLDALDAESRALATRDLAAAADAAALGHLDDLADQITANDEPKVPRYTVESIEVVPVYDPRNVQSGPQYGAEVHGTVTWSGSDASNEGAIESWSRTYALYLDGDRYRIAAVYPAG